jgi:hypothetical protein
LFEIKKAEREDAPITAAIIGGSGAGKTYSALLLARGLVGPEGLICVIDTEGGRPKIYANDPRVSPFYILDLPAPYTSERFREAYRTAEAWGSDKKLAIVVDTISHEHEGFLEFADQEEKRMSSRKDVSRSKWIKPKATRKRFYSAISSSHAHTIVTIRLNRIVDMEAKPAREIFKPECDKDLPYRMDLSMEVDPQTHATRYIKVPEPLKPMIEDGVMIDVRHGQALAADINRQKPGNSDLRKRINMLEETASSGVATFRSAWEAAWRNTAEADRPELMTHLDRMKKIAIEADEVAGEQGKEPDPETGDPGSFDDDTFPGDREGGLFQKDEGR